MLIFLVYVEIIYEGFGVEYGYFFFILCNG